MLFHLPLRQTEGFVASLLRLMGLHLNAPDHTTLSRRNRDLLVPTLSRADDRPIHLIVDSTGLKIYSAGEWCSRKHRKATERGGWRKPHIGVDDDGYVVTETLTQNTVDDANMLPDLRSRRDRRRLRHRIGSVVEPCTNATRIVHRNALTRVEGDQVAWSERSSAGTPLRGFSRLARHRYAVSTARALLSRRARCSGSGALRDRPRPAPPAVR